MDTRRMLLIGKTGQVGWELRRTLAPLGSLTCVDYPEVDLTDTSSIRALVRSVAPGLIVNAAAYTAVDQAESEADRAMAINGAAPGVLAEEARKLGALMVHYSTDYVFDGAQERPYAETDEPNPLGVYGRTKLAGDRAVEQAGAPYLIFRLCWVYGARGRNFMLTIQRAAREREQLRVVCDQWGAPTWSRMIAETTALALTQVLGDEDPQRYSGTYHLSASGHTSWHGFAEAIVARVPAAERKCREVLPIPSSEWKTPVERPPYSVLSCEKLARTFGLRLPHWQDSLDAVLDADR